MTRVRMPGARALPAVMAMLAVAGALTSCGFFGGGGGGEPLHLTAYFSRAISLYPQSDVRILGLASGEVKRIKVVGTRVRVDFTVDAGTPVPSDVKATIIPLSLIGERYLQLYPAWSGGPKIADHSTIPLERTTVPVEPDEALESLKNLLEDLNPDGARRLVTNLANDLDGQGDTLNDTIRNFAALTETLASRSDALGQIIDHFDTFTAALVTRERQLGQVMDDFATLTEVLADERKHVEGLVHNLARVAAAARDLVATHRAGLDRDLTTLGKVAKSIDANLATVTQLLDSGPELATGLQRAYNPDFHRIDLRNSFSPTAAQAVGAALGPLAPSPLAQICLPIDVDCTITGASARSAIASAPAANTSGTTTTTVRGVTPTTAVVAPATPANQLDELLGRLQPTRRTRAAAVGSPGGVWRAVGRATRILVRTATGVLR